MIEAAAILSRSGTVRVDPKVMFQEYAQILRDPMRTVTEPTSVVTGWLGSRTFAQVESLFVYQDYMSVSTYLHKHSFLVPLILEAYSQITQRFLGFQYHLGLEVSQEATSDEEALYLLICTVSSCEEVQPLLTKLDEEWWLDEVERADGQLTIDVEYL